jgi:hypothetical protein
VVNHRSWFQLSLPAPILKGFVNEISPNNRFGAETIINVFSDVLSVSIRKNTKPGKTIRSGQLLISRLRGRKQGKWGTWKT